MHHHRTISDLPLFAAAQAPCKPAAPTPQNPCSIPAEPPQEARAIRAALAHCTSPDRALTAPAIAEAADLWPDLSRADKGTRAREVITTWYEYMQIPGHVLIALSRGYWHTDDPEAVTHYHASLISRIRGIASRHRRVRLAAQTAGLHYHGKGRWTAPEADL